MKSTVGFEVSSVGSHFTVWDGGLAIQKHLCPMAATISLADPPLDEIQRILIKRYATL